MRGRPRAMAELQALLEERKQSYGRCEATVDTSDRSVEDVANEIAQRFAGA
jgi:shikimate kinase